MKKLSILLLSLLISITMSAGSFVRISYSSQAELHKLFDRTDLVIHHYLDDCVFATASIYDATTMTLLDKEAFNGNEVYYLIRCDEKRQPEYLDRERDNAMALYSNDHYLIMKPFHGILSPAKNDGACAISNSRAVLPSLKRDFPTVTEENSDIRFFLDNVEIDNIRATVQHMQNYRNRKWDNPNVYECQDWLVEQFEALGLEVSVQEVNYISYNTSGNVIAIQRGTTYPDEYVVCGCHYDSFSYSGDCPGADDNATGTASVLETARILSEYEFERSIIYCAFAAEEVGLIGSDAYAQACANQGLDIVGYFNNDMNGFLHGDEIHIDLIYPNSVAPIGDYYMNVASIYFPEMPVRHVTFNAGDSDHTSFNRHGYMGIYPFEDYQNYSPYIHTPGDTIGISVNSWDMSKRYCQMNIACLSEIAKPAPRGPIVVTEWALDDCNNNGYGHCNGSLNKGETVEITVTLQNTTEATLNNAELNISCNDEMITIEQQHLSIGTIAAFETKEVSFNFTLSSEAPDSETYKFSLEAVAGDQRCVSYINITSSYYTLGLGSMSVLSDSNDNGMLEPGETATMRLVLDNIGNSIALNVDAVISTDYPYITIEDNNLTFGSIAPGMAGYADLVLTLNTDAPEDYEIPFTLTIEEKSFEFAYRNACYAIFELTDSYGDGWNNAALIASFDNGMEPMTMTISNGNSATYQVQLSNNVTASLSWQSGGWDSECSYLVRYEDGTVIYSGTGTQSGTFFSWQQNCGGSSPNAFCNTIENLTASINQEEESVTLSWDAPLEKEPVRYDIYRETILVGNTTTTTFDDTPSWIGNTNYSVLPVYNDCQSTMQTINVYYDPWSVESESDSEIILFPNPAKNYVNIKGRQVSIIKIFDIMGQQVLPDITEPGENINININKLKPGIYVFVIHEHDGSKNARRLIVR